MEIEGEQAYPVYRVHAKWSNEGEQDPKTPAWWKGLPDGRVWNGTDFYRMPKAEWSVAEQVTEARDWWAQYIEKNQSSDCHGVQIVNPADVVLVVTFVHHETWCSGWFNHWTWDREQTDKEVVESFARFVVRMEKFNRQARWEGADSDPYCLMGAEDRIRWCTHTNPDGTRVESGGLEPPCRCVHCKEAGVIRIDH